MRDCTKHRFGIFLGLIIGCFAGVTVSAHAEANAVKVMAVNEISFNAQKEYANAYMDVDLWVDLNGPDGLSYRIPAFWDGGQTFRVRLVAIKPGKWTWSTGKTTGDSGLDNKSGSFDASTWTEAEKEANPNRRGFIRVASNKHTLEYADGTPFFYTADTWWSALTKVYAWGTDDCWAEISFQDAIAHRKAQGFNSINCIACFPTDTTRGLWGSKGNRVAEDGSTPFVMIGSYGVDYTQINPGYWQQIDRKMKYLWDQGFAPYLESLRRHEDWYRDSAEERNAFVNYTRYLWARYGCYNLIYGWIHCEGVNNKWMGNWRPMVRMAYEAMGNMPYGQPRTVMAWGSTLETWCVDGPDPLPDGAALPIGAFDIHTTGNRHRDFNNHAELRTIFDAVPTMPAANIEPFYPGWRTNKPSEGQDLNTMPQFNAYGCVLNGGFAGHAWGDVYYTGKKHGSGFDRWTAASMGYLKAFILDKGHDYRTLIPATMTHQFTTEKEFRVLALTEDTSVGLGFIAANHSKTDLIKLEPNVGYTFQWYNIDTGEWSKSSKLRTDGSGRLVLPNKPDTNGWAFRIISQSSNLSSAGIDGSAQGDLETVSVNYSALKGLERDSNGFLRRDNSDIIKVGDLYYVWYSKMNQFIPDTPVTSTIWYAISPDGHTWTEKGESLSTGQAGCWDDRYVYTPGILVAKGKYYLFYTAQSTVTRKTGDFTGKVRGIGIAVADSPDGPWEKLASNPALVPGKDAADFDSHVVDDSCLIVRDGRYWLYYKGRQWGKPPTETQMGVAIAETPEGSYIKHGNNPLVGGNHEVLVWPQGEGVAAMIGMKLGGRKVVPFFLMYADDGIHFEKTHAIPNQDSPWAPGAYRPEAFTDGPKGQMIEWGLHIGGERPNLYLERFNLVEASDN
ncbi:DUF4038 domain-containing protein [Planctomycetota bacterium]